MGHDVRDLGVYDSRPNDYPDIAAAVAMAVAGNEVDRGILLGWTGIGMTIVANKFADIRAALCLSETMAEHSRTDNDANVLCLSVGVLSSIAIREIVEIWMRTPFDGGCRVRQIEKIAQLERESITA
jgi:ribose 5-phosphate isomerase B